MSGTCESTVMSGKIGCEASESLASGNEALVDAVGLSAAGLKDVSQQDEVLGATNSENCGLVQAELVSSGLAPSCTSGIMDNAVDWFTSEPLPGTKDVYNGTSPTLHFADRGPNLTEFRGTKPMQVCAICHDKIKAEEVAEIKGCEHSYCVTCILRWASYKTEPWCPQCRLPFSFLYVYRALDGSLSDYLFEESVCLLLRALWFKPLVVQEPEDAEEYQDDYDAYEESYYTSSLRLGNRRWGEAGYVRAGRREARPIAARQVTESGGVTSSSSRQVKGKEPVKEAVGRRARRAQKREQLDKMSGKK